MTADYPTVAAVAPIEEIPTNEDPAIHEVLVELDGKIDELVAHHRVLSGLTKQAYQHSKQTWASLQTLITRVEGIEGTQAMILRELRSIGAAVEAIGAALEPTSDPAINADTPQA